MISANADLPTKSDGIPRDRQLASENLKIDGEHVWLIDLGKQMPLRSKIGFSRKEMNSGRLKMF